MKSSLFLPNRRGLPPEDLSSGRGYLRAQISAHIRLIVLAAFLASPCSMMGIASGQDTQSVTASSSGHKIKCVYLLTFAQLTTFPADALSPKESLKIGLIGTEPMGEEGTLKVVVERAHAKMESSGKRGYEFQHFQQVDEYSPCHVLFVTASVPMDQQMALLKKLGDKPVVLVGESPDFMKMGGIASFYLAPDSQVRFHYSHEATKEHRLKVDPRLYKTATIYTRASPSQ